MLRIAVVDDEVDFIAMYNRMITDIFLNIMF